jgi:hypothetical protein
MTSRGLFAFWNGYAETVWLLVKIEDFVKMRVFRKTCKFPSARLQPLNVVAQKNNSHKSDFGDWTVIKGELKSCFSGPQPQG